MKRDKIIHELNSNINSLDQGLYLLKEGINTDGDIRKYLELMQESIDKLKETSKIIKKEIGQE